jgi:FAD:protein FMN transferase
MLRALTALAFAFVVSMPAWFSPSPRLPVRRSLGEVGRGEGRGEGQSAARPPVDLQKLERDEEVMGSSVSIVLYGREQARLESAADAAFREVHRLDDLLSNYKAASEWSRVNREAGHGAVRVSDELFALLSRCLEYSRQSGGAFDITVGPLMKTWGFYKGEGSLPRPAEVSAVLERVGYRYVDLDPGPNTVRFTRPGVELDPGGIGKGYAVDRMVEVLKQSGVDIALVSASGSSIYGMGAPPDEPRGWEITIRTPRNQDEAAARIFLKDNSLSTSGSYEKFFWADGRTYAHIIDPRTGYPAQGTASVSVVAAKAIESEVWAKPFFINGRGWTTAHRPKALRVFLCEDAPQTSCAWIP